jgi:electron-transferring-flavoprotein dehydrogenase
LYFPGGALIGCSAGFVNVPKIKGTHNAMKSGMLAAETAFSQLTSSSSTTPITMEQYESNLKSSWVYKELHEVRNLRPSFNTSLGIWGGLVYSGIDSLIVKGRTPWTLKHAGTDSGHTGSAKDYKPIEYPPFEEGLSSDILTSVALTNTNHAEDQPVHLRLPYTTYDLAETGDPIQEDGAVSSTEEEERRKLMMKAREEHVKVNVRDYAGLLGRACPASVYEYVDAEKGEEGSWGGKKLIINSQVSDLL